MAALPKGVDVKAVDSSNAQSTFDAFTGAYLKQVGSAINIPYEVLLKNFTELSLSNPEAWWEKERRWKKTKNRVKRYRQPSDIPNLEV